MLPAWAVPPRTISLRGVRAKDQCDNNAKPNSAPATPAIAGARLALLFIASQIDQMATNTSHRQDDSDPAAPRSRDVNSKKSAEYDRLSTERFSQTINSLGPKRKINQ